MGRAKLIGKTVKGVLIKRRGGFFVAYNDKKLDNVFLSEKRVLEQLGPNKNPGMVAIVRCTIIKLGPTWKPACFQHPVAESLTLVTRYARKAHKGENLDAKRAALGLAPLKVRQVPKAAKADSIAVWRPIKPRSQPQRVQVRSTTPPPSWKRKTPLPSPKACDSRLDAWASRRFQRA